MWTLRAFPSALLAVMLSASPAASNEGICAVDVDVLQFRRSMSRRTLVFDRIEVVKVSIASLSSSNTPLEGGSLNEGHST